MAIDEGDRRVRLISANRDTQWRYDDSNKMLYADKQHLTNLIPRRDEVAVPLVRALHPLPVWQRFDLPYA
jgi:hypothetical protein